MFFSLSLLEYRKSFCFPDYRKDKRQTEASMITKLQNEAIQFPENKLDRRLQYLQGLHSPKLLQLL